MRILLATDAQWLADEVVASLGGPDTSFVICADGRDVSPTVEAASEPFDIAIIDLQIGSMGGMAATMSLRLDESAGTLPHVRVLMLLDRVADVFLARRSGAEGWLLKPIDSLRLRRAVTTIVAGGAVHEGDPVLPLAVTSTAEPSADDAELDVSGDGEVSEPAEPDPAPAG